MKKSFCLRAAISIIFFLGIFSGQICSAQIQLFSQNSNARLESYTYNNYTYEVSYCEDPMLNIQIWDGELYKVTDCADDFGNCVETGITFTGSVDLPTPVSGHTLWIEKVNEKFMYGSIKYTLKESVDIAKIKIADQYDLKNDTLTLCSKSFQNPYLELNLYRNSTDVSPFSSLFPNNFKKDNFGEDLPYLYINNKLSPVTIDKCVLNDGDKIKYIIYQTIDWNSLNEVGGNGMYCINQTQFDSLVSQTVTVRIKKNEILPRPTFLNDISSICAGDSVVLIKDPSLKQVGYCDYNSFYLNRNSDTTASLTYFQPTSVYLRSLNVRSNGCYALSDTVTIKRKNCGYTTISGYVYKEMNSSSGYNKGIDVPLENIKVKLQIANGKRVQYVFTDVSGFYQFQIDTNITGSWNANVSISDVGYYYANSTSYFSGNNNYKTVNLATYKLVSNDLGVSLISGRNRPGFTIPHYLNVSNLGSATNAGTLELLLDSKYTFVDASPSPSSIVGNKLTWVLPNILWGQTKYLTVNAQLPASTSLGTLVSSTLTLIPTVTDVNAANDIVNLQATVSGSFDPNDIAVTPKGLGSEGFIKDTTSLDYVIRCQNMGTDTAFTVVVKSKISPFLDFATFKMIDASHKYSLSMLKDTLVWTFSNIKLPDNKVNEPASHALIHYKIKQKAQNLPLSQIKNSAAIFFDYNAPVLTNEVLNTIEDPTITGLNDDVITNANLIYPNPTDGNFYIAGGTNGIMNVYNLLGEMVYTGNYEVKKAINLSHLPKGIYYLQTTDIRTKLILK